MNKRLLGLFVAVASSGVIVTACAGFPGISGLGQAPSVTGNWTVTEGTKTTSMTLAQDGDKVTGTYQQGISSSQLTGIRTSNKLNLTVEFSFGGATASTAIAGEVSSDGKKITGTAKSDTITNDDNGNWVTVKATESVSFTAVRKS